MKKGKVYKERGGLQKRGSRQKSQKEIGRALRGESE